MREDMEVGQWAAASSPPTATAAAPAKVTTGRRRRCELIAGLLVAIVGQLVASSQAAMSLPDGIENILGFVPTSSFQCQRDGYFGDIDNDCRLFHLCQKQVHPGGRVEWRHWTYACGNQTMFNQLTLTCAFVDEAIPCRHASQFQYLNEVIHKPREPFLTDADVTSGISYYSNRIMSDGARARAYEDAQLMAQLGGQQQPSFTGQPLMSQPAPVDELASRSSEAAEVEDRADDTRFLQAPHQQHHFNQINHQLNHQQHQQQPQPQQLAANFFAPIQPPVAAPVAQLPAANQQQQQQFLPTFSQPQVNSQVGGPQSFDFTITTNHHPQAHLATSTQSHHQHQQQLPSFAPSSFNTAAANNNNNLPSLGAQLADQRQQVLATFQDFRPPQPQPQQQPQQPQAAPTTTRQPQFQQVSATTRAPSQLAAATTTGALVAPTTTTTSTTTQAPKLPAASTESLAPVAPTSASLAAPTATTTTSTTATAAAASQQPARRRSQAASSGRANQQQQQHQLSRQASHNPAADFGHSPGFQSTRIVRNNQQPSALVMRASQQSRPPTTSAGPQNQQHQQSLVGEPAFWRRSPFDAHFLAPRFESFITRRRV